jgi:hypothetical protein
MFRGVLRGGGAENLWWRLLEKKGRIERMRWSMTIGRTLVVAMDVHGLGAFCLRPLRCIHSPASGVEIAGKLIGRQEEAGLDEGRDEHMRKACLLLRYLA